MTTEGAVPLGDSPEVTRRRHMLLGIVDEGQVGWAAVGLSVGLSLVAILRSMVESYNARCDKAQAAAEKKAEAAAALEAEKVAIAKAERERQDRLMLDSTIVDIKAKMAECDEKHEESDRKHQECEAARLADAEKTRLVLKEHLLGARERALAVAELQQTMGLPVTVVVPPAPPLSGTIPSRRITDPLTVEDEPHQSPNPDEEKR